ncbi:MAG: ABC transporter ATP-binding protein/permease [Bacteroidota bacterium]|nr:ABC transporter ATP-binding protein/permease [Bacteroidota bacterium]
MSKITGRAYDFPILTRVFAFVKPYQRIFRLTVFLTVLLAILGPVRPWLTQITLDTFIEGNDRQGLLNMTMLMVFMLLMQSLLQFFHNHQTNLLGQNVVRDMRVRLHRHILGFPIPYFDKTPIGTPVTRTISDMETIADIFSDGLIIIIGDILQLAAIITYMFYINWQLTLVSLSTVPLLLIATNVFKNNIKKTFNDVRTQVAALNVFVQEHLTGMRMVQVFNREQKEMDGFKAINKQHREANVKSVWYYSIFFPVVEILSAISIGLIVWWGAGDVMQGTASFGMLVAFIMYINLLFRPIRELADKFNTLQMGMVSSERIFKVFDTPSGTSEQGTTDAANIRGDVEFKNVWFAYNEEEWVLKNISFKVGAGESIAFVGATGSGKTTIINLINRFYEINKGEIFIDGINIKEYRVDTLRKKIAVVLQDVFLFSDTIKNNVTLGDPEITDGMIEDAAEMTGSWNFIRPLPASFDYKVGERGALLSMGQRQLIAFMRAYVVQPSILILDEATSSIDSESEALITKATGVLTHNRTSIIIAHRLATIQNATRIIVLDHGEIKEEGSHQELLKKGGWYFQLYNIQFIDKVAKMI